MRLPNFLFIKLTVPKFRIEYTILKQCLVISLLNYPSILHNENNVSLLDSRKPFLQVRSV